MTPIGIGGAGLYPEPSMAEDEELGPEVLELRMERTVSLLQPQLSPLGIPTAWTLPGRVTLCPKVLTLLSPVLPHLSCYLQLGPHV